MHNLKKDRFLIIIIVLTLHIIRKFCITLRCNYEEKEKNKQSTLLNSIIKKKNNKYICRTKKEKNN